MRDLIEDPVLAKIAGFIAKDEARHYRLFKLHLGRYLNHRKMGLRERIKIAYQRVAETEDDELAYAYYSANIAGAPGAPAYARKACASAYAWRSFRLYEFKHVRAAAHMILRAADLNPSRWWARTGIQLGWRALRWRVDRLAQLGFAAR